MSSLVITDKEVSKVKNKIFASKYLSSTIQDNIAKEYGFFCLDDMIREMLYIQSCHQMISSIEIEDKTVRITKFFEKYMLYQNHVLKQIKKMASK